MKVQLSLLCLLFLITTAYSQNRNNYSYVGEIETASKRDTNITMFRDLLLRSHVPKNWMPNAITTNPLPPVYYGNNGNGFDLYGSILDHMPILNPDSNFSSKMPVAKLSYDNIPLHITPNFNYLEPKVLPKRPIDFYKK